MHLQITNQQIIIKEKVAEWMELQLSFSTTTLFECSTYKNSLEGIFMYKQCANLLYSLLYATSKDAKNLQQIVDNDIRRLITKYVKYAQTWPMHGHRGPWAHGPKALCGHVLAMFGHI